DQGGIDLAKTRPEALREPGQRHRALHAGDTVRMVLLDGLADGVEHVAVGTVEVDLPWAAIQQIRTWRLRVAASGEDQADGHARRSGAPRPPTTAEPGNVPAHPQLPPCERPEPVRPARLARETNPSGNQCAAQHP